MLKLFFHIFFIHIFIVTGSLSLTFPQIPIQLSYQTLLLRQFIFISNAEYIIRKFKTAIGITCKKKGYRKNENTIHQRFEPFCFDRFLMFLFNHVYNSISVFSIITNICLINKIYTITNLHRAQYRRLPIRHQLRKCRHPYEQVQMCHQPLRIGSTFQINTNYIK